MHRFNYVSSEGKRTLAKISQQVTFPLFLFTKIIYCNQNWSQEACPDVTKSLRDVWILLLWPIVVVGAGFLVGYLGAIVSGTPKSQFRSVLAACGFGNSTGLPITLLTVVHANFPETSDLGHIDPTLFLSVYLLLYPVLQWGIGGWLLAPEDDDEDNIVDSTQLSYNATHDTAGSKTSVNANVGSHPHGLSLTKNVLNNKHKESFYKMARNGMACTDATLYISDADLVGMASKYNEEPEAWVGMPGASPLSPIADEETRKSFQTEEEEEVEQAPLKESAPIVTESTGLLPASGSSHRRSSRSIATEYQGESLCQTCQNVFERCFQPPVVGALLGIFVAATPLRGIFVDLIDRGSHAPLQFFFDGLYAVGLTAVPINMMILGCNLSASYDSQVQQSKASREEVDYRESIPASSSNLLSKNTLAAIVIGKMLIMPLIGIVLALFLERFVLDIPHGTLPLGGALFVLDHGLFLWKIV